MFVESLRQDARIAGRSLWRARGFAALAVVTLAIGIAGATAMFALIQGVLMRPLPVREQDRLLVAWTQPRAGGFNHVPYVLPNIERIGRESTLLESVSAVSYNGTVPFIVVDEGVPGYIDGVAVGGDFFDVLGVAPMLGRALTREDDRIGSDGAVVIGHRLWKQRYGGSPAVIGRRLTIYERPYTIVGVMPPDIEYPPARRPGFRWRSVTRARLPRIRTFASTSISSRGCGRACLSRRPRRNCRR